MGTSSQDFSHLHGSAASQQNPNDTITTTTNQVNATTQSIIVDLVFANSKSIRTSTIILASFNVLAAFATAFSILYDSYCAQSRRQVLPGYKIRQPVRRFSLSRMHPAETFPFILNIGIGIQGLVFAGVQGTGLSMLFIDGCSTISQFMWPALFIVPYINLVFGIECMRRACRHRPFQPRGKYDVSICLIIIVSMLIGTWIPSYVNPEPDHCFASLLWFISGLSQQGMIIFAVVLSMSVLSAVTICFRLSTFTLIDQHQRIAASRMVYYLALGSVAISFVLPYFILLNMGIASTTGSMIATVVLNLSGLLTGLLQLFLRSNTTTTAFKPKNLPNWSGDKHDIRLFGPNELGFGGHLLQPVSGPRTRLERIESQTSVLSWEKGRMSVESLRSPPPAARSAQRPPTYYHPLAANIFEGMASVNPLTAIAHAASNKDENSADSKLPKIPEPTVVATPRTNLRRPSYSLYPADAPSGQKKVLLPPSTFNSESAEPVQPAQPTPKFQVPRSKFQSMSPQQPFFGKADDRDVGSRGDESPLETFFGLSSSSSRPEAASVYSIGALLTPPPLFRNNSRHRRNSSLASTATVQIGLRLSLAQPQFREPDSPARLVEMPPPLSPPSTKHTAENTTGRSLLPLAYKPSATPESNSNNAPIASPTLSPKSVWAPSAEITRSSSVKSLPRSPRPTRQSPKFSPTLQRAATDHVLQLSSAVYTPPKSKASSVRSVSRAGSSASSQLTTSTRPTQLKTQTPQPRHQDSGDEYASSASPSRSATPAQEQASKKTKADWI